MRRQSCITALFILLPSCSSSYFIKNIDQFKPVAMENTKVAVDENTLRSVASIPKVVLLTLNGDHNPKINDTDLYQEASQTMTTAVLGRVNFITSFTGANEMIDAIKNGKSYQEPVDADYAMLGRVKEIKSSSKYKESNKESGDMIYITGYCDNSTAVTFEIDTYKIPSMTKLSTLSLTESVAEQSAPSGKDNIRAVKKSASSVSNLFMDTVFDQGKNADKCSYPNEMLQQHIKKATTQVFSIDKTALIPTNQLGRAVANTVSPYGYILEKRSNGEKAIYKISLGTNQGLVPKVDLEILELNDASDKNVFESDINKFKIGEGELSNIMTGDEAWMVVDDPDTASKIKKGDIVKVHYQFKPWKP